MDGRREVPAARLELALTAPPEVADDLARPLPLRRLRLLLVDRREGASRAPAGPEVAAREPKLGRPVRELPRDPEPALREVGVEPRAGGVDRREGELARAGVDLGPERCLDRSVEADELGRSGE